MKKSLPCDLQKPENGVDRGPESDTACVPMQLNNGDVQFFYILDIGPIYFVNLIGKALMLNFSLVLK